MTLNVKRLADKYGIEHIGFLTLTFKEHILCARKAQKKFHSLKSNVLNHRYVEWIRVLERQKSGRVHYHLLVVLADDIRTGVKFEEFANGVYKSANRSLRSEWAFWLRTCKPYGFGRHELMPVKSTEEAISKYVGKYIAKHIGQRKEQDKGIRLVAYSKGASVNNCKFAWSTAGAWLWRKKLSIVSDMLGFTAANYQTRFQEMFGKNWIYKIAQIIEAIRLETYPSYATIKADYPNFGDGLWMDGLEEEHLHALKECRINDGADHLPSLQTARRHLFALYAL